MPNLGEKFFENMDEKTIVSYATIEEQYVKHIQQELNQLGIDYYSGKNADNENYLFVVNEKDQNVFLDIQKRVFEYPLSVEHLKNQLITIYHGSDHEIKEPLFGKGSPDSDYGMGFYTTELQDKANQWALEMGGENAVTNEYVIDLQGLNVVNLDDYGPMAWIAEIAYNRGGNSELSQITAEIVSDMYKVDTSKADVIIGYRADSIYMQILDAFLEGKLTINETISLFKKGELGEQVCIVSEKAFEKIRFTKSYKCERIDMQAPIRQAKKEAMKFLNRREEELARGVKLQGLNVDDITANAFTYNQDTNQYEIFEKETVER